MYCVLCILWCILWASGPEINVILSYLILSYQCQGRPLWPVASLAGRGVVSALVFINIIFIFLDITVVRRDRYQARVFVDRDYYEQFYKDDLQCILTWLKRLTLRDILIDGTAGTATRRQRRPKSRRKQTWQRPVNTSLYLAIVLLLFIRRHSPESRPTKNIPVGPAIQR